MTRELAEAQTQSALNETSLRHARVLLASCETALSERDAALAEARAEIARLTAERDEAMELLTNGFRSPEVTAEMVNDLAARIAARKGDG